MLETYRMTNFLGRASPSPVNIKAMDTANMAAAASKRPPNMSSLSHRLTVVSQC
jgi:hypothetical protein